MHMPRFASLGVGLALASVLAACSAPPPSAWVSAPPALESMPTMPQQLGALRFIGALDLVRGAGAVPPHFGGISGLDHDPRSGAWYLLSDDRSERAPARVYTARLDLDGSALKSLRLDGGYITLLQRDGTPYPPRGAAGEAADPEALRLDPLTGMLTWASEGDFAKGLGTFVRHAGPAGRFMGEVPLPRSLGFDAAGRSGGRDNLTVEGLAYSADGRELWVAMESALVQDGPVASLAQPALARVSRLSRSGGLLAQYAYRVEAIPIAPSGGRRRADNGISDVLALGRAGQLLVVERAGREVDEGVFKFTVRLYLASADGATDIGAVASLQGAAFTPMAKTLLLDLAALNIGEIDNIEAAAWGPRLANGHATLVLVSDDNFSPRQKTQVLAFEVLPP
jgi:hypothetical protein